jgi:hypothetical protein
MASGHLESDFYKNPPPSRAVYLARKDTSGYKALIRHGDSLVYKIDRFGISAPEKQATNEN